MKEEVMKILQLVEEGKIKAEEAYRLLEAIGEVTNVPQKGKFIKVLVKDEDSEMVNIAVPLRLFTMLGSFLPTDAKAVLDEKEIDLDEIISIIQEGASGTIVNIESEDGEIVKIWIE